MFEELTEIREVDILGETDWHWIKGDSGSFGTATDGPMGDWLNSHQHKYFKYLVDNDVCVTAGTCCGMHVRFYQKIFKRVYAFEPEPLAFYCMSNNAQQGNVFKFNAALGNIRGPHRLQTVPAGGNAHNVGMNHVSYSGDVIIHMMTIDSLGLDTCDLIQLDVEGYEMPALMGARDTIDAYKPVVIAERFADEEAVAFMDKLGYDLVDSSAMDAIYIPK